MKNHVPLLDTSLLLKDAGFPQDTKFQWYWFDRFPESAVLSDKPLDNLIIGSVIYSSFESAAAPLFTEIVGDAQSLPEQARSEFAQGIQALITGTQHSSNITESAALLWLRLRKEHDAD